MSTGYPRARQGRQAMKPSEQIKKIAAGLDALVYSLEELEKGEQAQQKSEPMTDEEVAKELFAAVAGKLPKALGWESLEPVEQAVYLAEAKRARELAKAGKL